MQRITTRYIFVGPFITIDVASRMSRWTYVGPKDVLRMRPLCDNNKPVSGACNTVTVGLQEVPDRFRHNGCGLFGDFVRVGLLDKTAVTHSDVTYISSLPRNNKDVRLTECCW